MIYVIKLKIDDDLVLSENYTIESINSDFDLEFLDPMFSHYREVCNKYFLIPPPFESLNKFGFFACWSTPFGICIWESTEISTEEINRLFKECVDREIFYSKDSCMSQFNIEMRKVRIKMLLV